MPGSNKAWSMPMAWVPMEELVKLLYFLFTGILNSMCWWYFPLNIEKWGMEKFNDNIADKSTNKEQTIQSALLVLFWIPEDRLLFGCICLYVAWRCSQTERQQVMSSASVNWQLMSIQMAFSLIVFCSFLLFVFLKFIVWQSVCLLALSTDGNVWI